MRILLVILMCLFSQTAIAKTTCFIAVEDGEIIEKTGNCAERFPPCSTFKVPLAVMGFDSGILKDAKNPVWKYQEGFTKFLKVWEEDHWPQKWLKNSCVWYSQEMNKKMGMEKFAKYIEDFNYGNMDVSGDEGKNNGLTHSWLSSSLQISPMEQISFLEQLLSGKLAVSKDAHEKTIQSIESFPFEKDWTLHGKTGSGYKGAPENKIGWYIGWLENGDRKIIFVHLIEGQKINGLVAKEEVKEKLTNFVGD